MPFLRLLTFSLKNKRGNSIMKNPFLAAILSIEYSHYLPKPVSFPTIF